MPPSTKHGYSAMIELLNVFFRLSDCGTKQTDENLRQSDTQTANMRQSSLIDYKHGYNQYLTEWASVLGPG